MQSNIYARYNYNYELKAFSLTRDNSEITYTISRTENDKQYTNKNVLLTINLNKPIEKVEGFEISADGKKLTKTVTQNEANTIVVEDISGNKKSISYAINNIDKIPPEIIGVENGAVYSTSKAIQYKDNVGIGSIYVDRYSSLVVNCYDDYYDTSFYKGIDVTCDTIYVDVISHPKNTKYYLYYLNGVLKAKTTESEYKFTGLLHRTEYTITVEAVDSQGNVLQSVTEKKKTKYFSSIGTEKGSSTFKVTLYGIDYRISGVYGVGYLDYNNKKYLYPTIGSDRSVTLEFSAYDFGSIISNGYYYFHINLLDSSGAAAEIVCCNVIFNTNYIKEGEVTLDPNNLIYDGNYQIIVTDLAGNITEKNITISR